MTDTDQTPDFFLHLIARLQRHDRSHFKTGRSEPRHASLSSAQARLSLPTAGQQGGLRSLNAPIMLLRQVLQHIGCRGRKRTQFVSDAATLRSGLQSASQHFVERIAI